MTHDLKGISCYTITELSLYLHSTQLHNLPGMRCVRHSALHGDFSFLFPVNASVQISLKHLLHEAEENTLSTVESVRGYIPSLRGGNCLASIII